MILETLPPEEARPGVRRMNAMAPRDIMRTNDVIGATSASEHATTFSLSALARRKAVPDSELPPRPGELPMEGSGPKRLIRLKEIPSYNLSTVEVAGEALHRGQFLSRTTRHSDPLNPSYKLPGVPQEREGLIATAMNDRPGEHHGLPWRRRAVRDPLKTDDLPGARAKPLKQFDPRIVTRQTNRLDDIITSNRPSWKQRTNSSSPLHEPLYTLPKKKVSVRGTSSLNPAYHVSQQPPIPNNIVAPMIPSAFDEFVYEQTNGVLAPSHSRRRSQWLLSGPPRSLKSLRTDDIEGCAAKPSTQVPPLSRKLGSLSVYSDAMRTARSNITTTLSGRSSTSLASSSTSSTSSTRSLPALPALSSGGRSMRSTRSTSSFSYATSTSRSRQSSSSSSSSEEDIMSVRSLPDIFWGLNPFVTIFHNFVFQKWGSFRFAFAGASANPKTSQIWSRWVTRLSLRG